jgi:hypothetical protein
LSFSRLLLTQYREGFGGTELATGDTLKDLAAGIWPTRRLGCWFITQGIDDLFQLGADGGIGNPQRSFDFTEVAATADEEEQERLLIARETSKRARRPVAADDRAAV